MLPRPKTCGAGPAVTMAHGDTSTGDHSSEYTNMLDREMIDQIQLGDMEQEEMVIT